MPDKIDLRSNDWRKAIVDIADAIEKTQLTNRALALLISDSCPVKLTQALHVLNAIPKLKNKYLKEN